VKGRRGCRDVFAFGTFGDDLWLFFFLDRFQLVVFDLALDLTQLVCRNSLQLLFLLQLGFELLELSVHLLDLILLFPFYLLVFLKGGVCLSTLGVDVSLLLLFCYFLLLEDLFRFRSIFLLQLDQFGFIIFIFLLKLVGLV